jgi:DNA-binding CsgD family transcriptional regulator
VEHAGGCPGTAETAVALARATGSAQALSCALTTGVMSRVLVENRSGADDAQAAQDAAIAAGDFWAFVNALQWTGYCLDGPATPTAVETLRRGRERLTAHGAPHAYIAQVAAGEALALIITGRWRQGQARLCQALGRNPGPAADILARLGAGFLAVRQGRPTEAASHLIRVEEIVPNGSSYKSLAFDAIRAELAVTRGDTETVLASVAAGVALAPPPVLCERLLPLAARALADRAQAHRDRREYPDRALERLWLLRAEHPRIIEDGLIPDIYRQQVQAHQASYDAETERAHARPGQADAWTDAAERHGAAHLPWDAAYAWWRAAQAAGPVSRRSAAQALRNAYDLAVDLGARQLVHDLEALAAQSRIPLASLPPQPEACPSPLPGLTPREAEILDHITAGRTYGEIARALVLSDKTVSTHVSHLLRKTATHNRHELAELVRRLSSG